MLEVLIPKGFAETSTRLVKKLVELGVDAKAHYTFKGTPPSNPSARVCWGIGGYGDVPELNKKAGLHGKRQELELFHKNGIPAPVIYSMPPVSSSSYPILARRSQHAEGNDIKLCEDREKAQRTGADFYVGVIPSSTEYRVWVFKNVCLGVYERQKIWPVEREGFGRNWWNGYGYVRLWEGEDQIPTTAIELAKKAIAAVNYDFGAVDILKGTDRRYYVLECNAAPGAEGYATRALRLLAEQVKNWYEHLR